jgi:PHD/YefM family antitoxin component YafN of YafNO toxin-antitoxin module
MISNRYRLTPEQQQKLSAKANELRLASDLADSQYLITNRLRELAVLLTEKNHQIVNTRNRLAQRITSPVLERELTEQQEQVEDLTQLASDWLKLLGLCQREPAQSDLSEVLQEMLHSLGLDLLVPVQDLSTP